MTHNEQYFAQQCGRLKNIVLKKNIKGGRRGKERAGWGNSKLDSVYINKKKYWHRKTFICQQYNWILTYLGLLNFIMVQNDTHSVETMLCILLFSETTDL